MKRLLLALFLPGPLPALIPPPEEREMSADRPDTTESAFTVPQGRWQFEWELLSVSSEGGQRSRDWGGLNLKYGLTDSIDLQWVTPAWHDAHGPDGWTDTELRLKWNLCGQEDGGALALALMPYVKLPTASHGLGNGDVEGGFMIPMALTGIPFAWMVQADVLRKEDDSGYTGALTLSATTGCELAPRLSGFVEAVATLPLHGDAETYLNGGLVLEVTPNWMLDAGVNFGINEAAEDWRAFTGVSFRF